ncbi:MAG: NAD(P)/FAD-dependent oxidoreductase [Nitrospirales bacterium]|nr:MAG: NAD(P)/FAD-dependent oxidoreductase [Nitrospirales bacterium]TFG66079.1 MAG: NAD(P)/FAD-dependent oxidoreductase [Nitrospirales bacterium]
MPTHHLDIAILGAGLAGNLLARQLRQAVPHLKVGMFEKSGTTSFKVGESTVEVTGNYLIRRLGLGTYLTEHHIVKNGLRFFFDQENRQAPLIEMSEIGGIERPFHKSFQLDRSKLETDLQRMNQEDGVELHLGSRVSDIQLSAHSTPHQFSVETASKKWNGQCRWLIDASGRSSILAKQENLRIPESHHILAAVWGRFKNVANLDTIGPETFRQRVNGTSRHTSTTHFCYPGYWIWFIPISQDVVSVGIVMERTARWQESFRKAEGFLNFLKQHHGAWSLLREATLLDIGSLQHLTYGTRQFFSRNRWGLTGESAAFTDPFYSPGSDFIALENDLLTNLIRHEEEGASTQHLQNLVNRSNAYMHFRYEASMRLYRNLYSLFGSYELLKLKWQLDFPSYYHIWLSEFMQDLHLNEEFLIEKVREQQPVLNALSNFSQLFKRVEQHLHHTKSFYRGNLGNFTNAVEGVEWLKEVGQPQTPRQFFTRLHEIFNCCQEQANQLLGTSETVNPLPLSHFLTLRPSA